MPEPIKCPRCKEGTIYERGYDEYYYELYRDDAGKVSVATVPIGGAYEKDCYICLDCGAMLVDDEILEIFDGGDA